MVYSFGPAAYATTISNRTEASGGSAGGNKKPGIFGGSVSWSRGNLPASVFYRAPQRPSSLAQLKAITNLHPVQRRRNGYSVSHGLM